MQRTYHSIKKNFEKYIKFLYKNTLLVSVLFLLIAWMWALASMKAMATDGSYYILKITEQKDFFFVGWHRHHAQVMTQWLPVAALQIYDFGPEATAVLYSISIAFLASFSIFLIFRIARESEYVIIFPIISLSGISLSGDYIIIGEYHVLNFLVWPLLIYCIIPTKTIYDRILVFFCAIVLLRSYEGAIFILWIPLCICLYRAYSSRSRSDNLFWISLAVVLLLGMVIAIDGFVSRRNTDSMRDLWTSLATPFGSIGLVSSLIFGTSYLAAYATGRHSLVVAGAVVSAGLAIYGLMTGSYPDSWQSFSSRTTTITVLPFLMLACISCALMRHRVVISSSVATIVFCAALSLYVIAGQTQWKSALGQLKAQLDVSQGFVPYENMDVPHAEFFPYWTLPTLSVLLQPECVRAIILIPEDYPWQPFDPFVTRPISAHRQYTETLGGEGCR